MNYKNLKYNNLSANDTDAQDEKGATITVSQQHRLQEIGPRLRLRLRDTTKEVLEF